MDFKGQLKAQRIMQIVLVAAGIISYVVAWFYQQISICTYTVIGAGVLLTLLIGPEYPWFNESKFRWVSKSIADKDIVDRVNKLRERDGLLPHFLRPVAASSSVPNAAEERVASQRGAAASPVKRR